jgi:hypothetical protein
MKLIMSLFILQFLFLQTSWARQGGTTNPSMNRSQDVFDGRGENKYNSEAHDQDRLRERQKIQKQEAELKKDRLKKKLHQTTP